ASARDPNWPPTRASWVFSDIASSNACWMRSVLRNTAGTLVSDRHLYWYKWYHDPIDASRAAPRTRRFRQVPARESEPPRGRAARWRPAPDAWLEARGGGPTVRPERHLVHLA